MSNCVHEFPEICVYDGVLVCQKCGFEKECGDCKDCMDPDDEDDEDEPFCSMCGDERPCECDAHLAEDSEDRDDEEDD